MRPKRLIAVFLAVTVCIPLCCCDFSDLFQEPETSEADHAEQRYPISELKEQVEAYQKSWSDSAETPDLQSQIEAVQSAVDEAYAIHCRAQIAYYADWHNDDLDALNLQCTEDYYVADEIASWFFANGYQFSAEPDLFQDYIEEDDLKYYASNSLNRVIAHARSSADSESERIESYYDLAYDDTADISVTNIRCANIYLDSLKELDVSDALYAYYNRDYTAAEASAAFQMIKERFVPLRDAVVNMLLDSADELLQQELADDPYDLLQKYAAKLSPSIAESAEKLFSEHLFTKAEGVNCYDGSFTINLPNEQTGLMYTYLSDSILDLVTVTHEFGHFHSDWRDKTPICLQSMNLDLAEAQSQSMVTLFMPYYPEIFKDNAEQMQLLVLLDLLDSVISGFAVGEFEYQVTQRLDDISPAETAALFSSLMKECSVDLEFYEVTHLFEQPGYYISYGVSALPALEMYTIVQTDPDKAISVYDHMSRCSCLSGEYGFREVMQSCGFSDYFTTDEIGRLADSIDSILKNYK